MKTLRTIVLAVLTVVVLCAAAFAAGFALQHWDTAGQGPAAAAPSHAPTADPSADPSTEPSGSPTTSEPTSEPTVTDVLAPGDHGPRVRELQSRLYQLAWFPEITTGVYVRDTKAAVVGFQDKRGLPGTGAVDQKTWNRLVRLTRMPTHDELFNVLHPGPALFSPGDEGEDVRAVQARLKSIAWYFGDVTGTYDSQTTKAVRGFQAKREIPVTGEVDQRTLERLTAMTYTPTHEAMYNIEPKPGALDARCRTGRVLCIDKTSRTLRWVVDGEVLKTVDVRFGSEYTPTREGVFHVYSKSRDHVSSLYGSSMPFAMFFSGGQAVHYS